MGKVEGSPMLAFKYLLMILGVALFGSASALVVYDIYLSTQLRRLLRCKTSVRRSTRALIYKIGFSGCSAGQGLR
jgi:hypothetical protein